MKPVSLSVRNHFFVLHRNSVLLSKNKFGKKVVVLSTLFVSIVAVVFSLLLFIYRNENYSYLN